MEKTIKKKKSTRVLATLILCSFLLLPIVPVFAEENVGATLTEEKPALLVEEKSIVNSILEAEPIKNEPVKNVSENIADDNDGEESAIDDEVNVKKDERDFSNVVKQTTEYTCGPAALATLINLMGGKAEEMEMAKLSGTTEEKGTTMLGLKKAASEFGYSGSGKKIRFDKIIKESFPFIVKVNIENEETKEIKDHFVVLKKIEDNKYYIADPVDGNVALKEGDFEKTYGGSIFSVSMTKNSEVVDPISGNVVKLKDLSQEGALELIEEMSDEEMDLESGKFAALLRLLPPAIRAVIAKTGLKVTKSFVDDLRDHPDRLKAYLKAGDVMKKGKTYYDVTSKAIVKIYDDYMIMYGKESNALMNAYKFSEKKLKSKLKQGTWIKK